MHFSAFFEGNDGVFITPLGTKERSFCLLFDMETEKLHSEQNDERSVATKAKSGYTGRCQNQFAPLIKIAARTHKFCLHLFYAPHHRNCYQQFNNGHSGVMEK